MLLAPGDKGVGGRQGSCLVNPSANPYKLQNKWFWGFAPHNHTGCPKNMTYLLSRLTLKLNFWIPDHLSRCEHFGFLSLFGPLWLLWIVPCNKSGLDNFYLITIPDDNINSVQSNTAHILIFWFIRDNYNNYKNVIMYQHSDHGHEGQNST